MAPEFERQFGFPFAPIHFSLEDSLWIQKLCDKFVSRRYKIVSFGNCKPRAHSPCIQSIVVFATTNKKSMSLARVGMVAGARVVRRAIGSSEIEY